ncbi:MAG: M48 family metallopeptidase [Nitrospirota bacterium]|nr:M48 family metallopeptidase [Nitrospirota bacterium]
MIPPTTWEGQYFDGQSPVPQLARIEILGTSLEITTINEERLSWPFQEIRQTQGHYTGEEVRLERQSHSGEVLVIKDIHFLTALHHLIPTHVRHFHNPRTRSHRIWLTFGAGVIALPLLWLLYAKGVPALAGPLTYFIPHTWEQSLGKALFTEIVPGNTQCTDHRIQQKIDALLDALVGKIGPTPHSFQVTIVDQPIMNAVALPGGSIIIFRGLLEKTETPEELAGVLAHEIQHILQRHGMRLLVQNMTLGLIIGALTGDVSGIMAFVLEGTHMLQSLSYSRAAEEEADQKGMELLLKTGINPKGMLSFFEYMQTQRADHDNDHLWQYLSTHPLPQDRTTNLEHLASQEDATYRPLFPLDDWKQLILLCNQDLEPNQSGESH